MNRPLTSFAETLEARIEQMDQRIAELERENARLRAEIDERLKGLPGECMTEKEVCERLSISATTLWRLRQQGQIRCVFLGGALRFRREDVDALVESRSTKQGPLRKAS